MLYDFLANSAAWASFICYAAAAIGCAYALCAAWAVRGFACATTPASSDQAYPAVTILKPLHGSEPGLYRNLRSFCEQDYPAAVQIVCGVDDAADPAVAAVRQLIAECPDRDLALTVDGRRYGTNRKISNLINMVRAARHDILILSDSDIVAPPDYLRSIAEALQRPGVGLVTCLYTGRPAAGIWSRLAAAGIDYHFLPNVLAGLQFGLATPCFGSTIALRASTLAAIGGFEAVADQLADDYVLGALVRRTGLAVAIAAVPVVHVCAEHSAGDLIRHETRWARTIRAVDPRGFAGSAVTHAVPFALLGLILGGLTPAASMVAITLACRSLLQATVIRTFGLRWNDILLGPVRDVLSFAIFVTSFLGRGVEWRGHRYALDPDRKLAYFGKVEI